jgi:hypothetical protein
MDSLLKADPQQEQKGIGFGEEGLDRQNINKTVAFNTIVHATVLRVGRYLLTFSRSSNVITINSTATLTPKS